ncbi:MAG: histidinol dehydrogenase [Rhodospirillaceae bacterium]|nr:histidinol dehydrogenase [Rhodospirillaceae bacterium]MBT5514886.1 histidinol dehydrogenase [Rhodospirillaceae bacterium]MBT6609738.1 histidinol dehydrogenase [Rhodospirillaceae bacterium]MBT6883858.1 histidinol dehydrogenase [Rhodospirillaceae bacterium]
MPKLLDTQSSGFADEFTNFLDGKRETARDVNDVVAGILNDVRSRGDAALIEATQKFDKFDLTPQTMAFSPKDIAAARDDCERGTLDALELAAQRIEDFHQRQIPDDLDHTDADGVRLGYRWTAVGAAGLYVPGGTAAYPSSVLMNAIPAKVAGVDRLVMVVPTPNGVVNPLVLAAAGIAGVDTIYRIGGAQAVGALAYGTETISPVDKIVGPGNAYVAAAKRQVYGTVGIDMIAGPSEILVLADGENDPAWIAADLLSQAEHDLAAQAILMTDDRAFADAVVAAVDGHLKTLPRADTAGESWRNYGAVIIVPEIADALPLIDRIAPEHLEIATEDARALAMQVRNAGAIFMGRFVPEALGDYLAGPNHVLPTARSARFSSGLGVLDFMKRTSMIECSSEGLNAIGPAAVTLARAEGLDAHALSVSIRLNKPARS